MWNDDQAAQSTGRHTQHARSPMARRQQQVPHVPDVEGAWTPPDPADVADVVERLSDDTWDMDGEVTAGSVGSSSPPPSWPADQARQILREFLRAVPRAEPAAVLALTRPDGSVAVLTRAQLTAAIDALRPRQRQIVRLTLEEGWTRQRTCDYLHISLKTLIRDQAEALDALIRL